MTKPAFIAMNPIRIACLPLLLLLTSFLIPPSAALAQGSLVVYDDALSNGFQNWSWVDPPADLNLAANFHVHSGSHAIFFRAHSWQGASFARPGQPISTAQWPELRLWVRGDVGGEQLGISLQTGTTIHAQANLNAFIQGGGIAAGQYRQAVIRFGQPPLSYNGSFERINLTDLSGNPAAEPQFINLDHIVLHAAGGGVDLIFANGFEGGGAPPANGLVITRNVAIDGITGDRFAWTDSAGLARSAVLAHNNAGTAAGGSRGGELREFRYRTAQGERHVRAPTSGSNARAGGFGYVVAHPTDSAACAPGDGLDPSSLGHFTPGQFQRVFEGRHHAILRFTQNYPRYCTRVAPAAQHAVPVTIDWLITNGRDNPLWSVTWDLSTIAADRLEDDTRAPYGELLFDGAANTDAHSVIAGVGWGDRYKFTTTSAPATYNSHWTWNQPNTVPYVKLWTTTVDATMGTVATQTITQQDAGGYWATNLWNSTSAAGNGCTLAIGGVSHRMPCSFNWPFQSINYATNPFTDPNVSTRSSRLAWGSNFGFLGRTSYPTHGHLGNAPGWPRKSYSTHVVLGTHSADPVGMQVTQVETVQTLSLSATVGNVVASGPSGVADATARTYSPSGYDPVYGALRFNASNNRVTANIAIGAGTLRHPLLVIGNYNGGLPTTLRLNGQTLVRDQDWLPSPRPDAQQLWITLKRNLSGAGNSIELIP